MTALEPISSGPDVRYVQYQVAQEKRYLPLIRDLISHDLSEPYSIYVYRYFLYQWSDLCYMALAGQGDQETLVGVVVNKLEPHRGGPLRGYIAMLAVRDSWRGQGIASRLVRLAIDAMIGLGADEIALEAEITNRAAMKLYERMGFLRSKSLHRYYLNGNTAFRYLLYIRDRAVTAGQAAFPDEDDSFTMQSESSLQGTSIQTPYAAPTTT